MITLTPENLPGFVSEAQSRTFVCGEGLQQVLGFVVFSGLVLSVHYLYIQKQPGERWRLI